MTGLMARKVFISFLGTTFYEPGIYWRDNFYCDKTRFIQVATLQYLQSLAAWGKDDKVIILLTEKAKQSNWIDYGSHPYKNETYKGLESELKSLDQSFGTQALDVPDGNNEAEILEIFTRLFHELKEGDELYFDVTHGFRSLPMLAIVLGNYTKFLKSATVKSITYGNWEARQDDKAPIIDLQALSNLQDWTFAAADYIENGNATRISKLTQEKVHPILRDSCGKDKAAKSLQQLAKHLQNATDDFLTCRGLNIVNATNITLLKRCLDEVSETTIRQLDPILEKINESFNDFDSGQNVLNGILAAQWCLDNAMYQQAATLLQETIVSFFCLRHSIRIDDDKKRERINRAFRAIASKDTIKAANEDERDSIAQIINTDELMREKEIYSTFASLSELRNDINHSGMRSSKHPQKANDIKQSITNIISFYSNLLIHNGCKED